MIHRRLLLSGLSVGLAFLAACTTPTLERADTQIRDRILSIRDAIRAKQPEGIIRWGTDDWTFTGPNGQAHDKASYLARAQGLFERTLSIDALETSIDRISVGGDRAEVEITQRMERHERNPATGRVQHLRLRYREAHVWVRTPDGWRVQSVRFLGTPDHTVLGERL